MSHEPIQTVVRRRWTRRDALKAAPIAAVGAGAAGLLLHGRSRGETVKTRGTCRFCQMHCGVVCTVQGGQLLKVEGDLTSRTRGFVCEHGYALRELLHASERLSHPLVRRGSDFHEVSWDEAFGEIATRLAAVKQKFGPEALAIQTGWPFVRHPLVGFLHRFARAFGSPNVATVASLCEASLRMGQALTVGSKYAPDVRRAKTLVVWGANPWTTAPPFAHVVSRKAIDGNLIVIDPVKTALAKEATLHLPVRPGTDGALALGFIHLAFEQGAVDQAFTRDFTLGADALRSHAAEYPLERVAQLTGLLAADIARAASLMFEHRPTSAWVGLGVEHHEGGVQAIRAISSLEALLGRFSDVESDRSLLSAVPDDWSHAMLPALYDMKTPDPVPPEVRVPPVGRESFPLFEVYNREAQGEALPRAILESKPYPVRALVLWASNALETFSGTQQWARAAEKLSLLVSVDPFLSDSARRADVVLPATTFAESADVDADDRAVGSAGMVPPHPGAKTDWQILVGLAQATGLGSYFPWATFGEAMAAPMKPWMLDDARQPRFDAQAEKPRFGTPSGRVEFQSRILERAGYAALPVYTPPVEAPTDDYPLRLVTGPRARARINSQFSQSPSIRARLPEAEVLVHPSVASAKGITHGQRVRLTSPLGQIELRAVVTADVHPECVVMPAGWAQANPNRLVDPARRDPLSGFPAFRSSRCRIDPA